MDEKQAAALAADEVSRQAFKAWQAEKDPVLRRQAAMAYDRATKEAKRLWAIVGPDPLISQLAKAQAVTDAEEGHDADE